METSGDSYEEGRVSNPDLLQAVNGNYADDAMSTVSFDPFDFINKSVSTASLVSMACDAAGPSGFYENRPTDKSVQTAPCTVDLISAGNYVSGPSGSSQDTEVTSSSVGYVGDQSRSSVLAYVDDDDATRTVATSDLASGSGSSPKRVALNVAATDKSFGSEDAQELESGPPVAESKQTMDCEPGKSETTVAVQQENLEVAPKTDEGRSQPSAGEEVHRPEPVSSPEPNCAICLGKMQNKSFTNSCFHQFCFTCLLEWSKVKAECPLCKQPFKSIVHNVRSMEDYDQYYLRSEEFSSWDYPSASASASRFRYRSTLTSERRRELNLGRLLTTHNAPNRSPSASSSAFVPVRHLYSTSDFRRYIYQRDLWVVANVRSTRMTRMREASPEFYTANPACTHRLLPWLNRELNALNYGHQTTFLLELITSLVLRFHIQSPEFVEHLRPYFLNNTAHFIHEFHSFARSPYDMGEYDRHSRYDDVTSPSGSGNEDPDVVVLSHRENIIPLRPTAAVDVAASRFGIQRIGHPSLLNRARDFLAILQSHKARSTATAGTTSTLAAGQPGPSSSPQPGPSGMGSRVGGGAFGSRVMRVDHVLSSSDDDSEDELLHSIINARSLSRHRASGAQLDRKPLITIHVDDEDDCMIVDVVGKTQRSPVAVIQLSDSDDDVRIESADESPLAATPVPGLSTSTSSSSTIEPPTPLEPKLPSLKIKLSLTKARQASLAAKRAARRRRAPSTSSSRNSATSEGEPSDSCIRSPSPSSSSPATPPSGDSGTAQQRSSTPDSDSSSDDQLQPQTVRSKVIRLDVGQNSWGGSSTSSCGLSHHRFNDGGSGNGNSLGSRSRSRSHSQQSSHSSSGTKKRLSKKHHHSSGKHRRRPRDENENAVSEEAANNSLPTKSSSSQKKSKKHKHRKSGEGSKHKHSRQSKALKREESGKT